jgi:hypothetical protein
MKKWAKALVLLAVLTAFVISTLIALRYATLWQIYRGYVETVTQLTGFNSYLITAAAALVSVPFFIGANFLLSVSPARRHKGLAILVCLFVLYNVGLFFATRDASFGFASGETLKWYAMTPEGVRYYDHPGVDPIYGIELKPVTRDNVRELKRLEQGEALPIDPEQVEFFNAFTGDPQVWYSRDGNGKWEFYNRPGYHPRTGAELHPVSHELYEEWFRELKEEKRHQREAEKEARQREVAQAAQRTAQSVQEADRRAAASARARDGAKREQMLASGSVVHTTIQTTPSGAKVSIDKGEFTGVTPMTVLLKPGPHGLEIRKSGYRTKLDMITVSSTDHKFQYELRK